MNCPNCRNWVPNNASFCQTCGQRIDYALQVQPTPKTRSSTKLLIAVFTVGFVAFGLISLAGLFAYRRPQPTGSSNVSSRPYTQIPSNPPQSQTIPTSKIVMRFVWFGASFSSPVMKGNVTIKTGGKTFQKRTSNKGWLVLDGVPCNQNIKVSFGQGGMIAPNAGEPPFDLLKLITISKSRPTSDVATSRWD